MRKFQGCPAEVDSELVKDGLEEYRQSGEVNSRSVTVLRDCGCSRTLVKSDFVPPGAYRPGEYVGVRFADCVVHQAPLADVYLATKGVIGSVCVGVLENLVEDVLLGNDVGPRCVPEVPKEGTCVEGSTEVACVASRSQKLKQVAEELQAQQSMFQSGVRSQTLTEETEAEAKQRSVLSDDFESDEDGGSGVTDSRCDSVTDSPLESLFSECSHDQNEQRSQVSSQVSDGEIFQYGT